MLIPLFFTKKLKKYKFHGKTKYTYKNHKCGNVKNSMIKQLYNGIEKIIHGSVKA